MIAFSFGGRAIDWRQVFFVGKHTIGIVNLKPVLPGHVLLVAKRPVKGVADLQPDEQADLFVQAAMIGKIIEPLFKGTSSTFVIQDGKEAGQTVPHVHMHVIPRHVNDLLNNDEIYDKLAHMHVDCEEKKPRSMDDMAAEAEFLRDHLSMNGIVFNMNL